LQGAVHLLYVLNVFNREGRDVHAIGAHLRHALAGQSLDGLVDRRAAHMELLGQGDFVEAVLGLELPGRDCGFQELVGLLGEPTMLSVCLWHK
jgi:hypothetical protein